MYREMADAAARNLSHDFDKSTVDELKHEEAKKSKATAYWQQRYEGNRKS